MQPWFEKGRSPGTSFQRLLRQKNNVGRKKKEAEELVRGEPGENPIKGWYVSHGGILPATPIYVGRV